MTLKFPVLYRNALTNVRFASRSLSVSRIFLFSYAEVLKKVQNNCRLQTNCGCTSRSVHQRFEAVRGYSATDSRASLREPQEGEASET